jgi:serine protein kinase
MILAMNLFETEDRNRELWPANRILRPELDTIWENYRPMGACSGYIWNDIRSHCDGNIEAHARIRRDHPGAPDESLGTVTGKYPAKDKITSSAVDLLGEESIQRLLHITDTNNPYRFDLRRGALARVAGGGIHFSDEIFKNKKDLVQVYLGVIQNRTIEIDGYKWPIDTLIIATSNNSEFNRFLAEKEEAPIVDRCRLCYVATTPTTSCRGADRLRHRQRDPDHLNRGNLHQDPNLNYAASVAAVLTRLPRSEKLTPIETMKLAAGEVAGEKSIKTLAEVIDTLNQDPTSPTASARRAGPAQPRPGHPAAGRELGDQRGAVHVRLRRLQDPGAGHPRLRADANDRAKYLEDIKTAKGLYRERIMTEMFNAYMDEPQAIRKDVHELRQHDHRHRRRKPRPRQDVEVQGPPDRRAQGAEGRRALHQQRRGAPAAEDRGAAGELPHLHPQDLRPEDRHRPQLRLHGQPGAGQGGHRRAPQERHRRRRQPDRRPGQPHQRGEPEALRPHDHHHADQAGLLPTCAQKTIEYFCTQEDEN